MNAWLKNAQKNLLPLSLEKEVFTKAIREWSFTGETIDYELAEENCQLCEMEGLRYHYQISNNLGNSLWVGSSCIERFDILVVDEEGTEISNQEKEIYLKNKLKDKHLTDVLISLNNRPSNDLIKGHLKSDLDKWSISQMHKPSISAKLLNYIFMRLDEEKIYHNKRFFTISIRSDANKEAFLKLNETQFNRIKMALSGSQIKYYLDHK